MLRKKEAEKNNKLRISCVKTQFIKNQGRNDEHIKLDGAPIAQTSSYMYIGCPLNLKNNMKRNLTEEGEQREPPSGLSKKSPTK
ncbi:hypothetical protein KIN20_000845 [Parelaphostrongylus tenuis]|uniref:Uncharacterized protein n=1 Tax=Parelaphostrongylus tenuis TaxID=148309 RepID=A0AAD5QBU6_PARTN|nr:hypothetical protein KIN20_000845 [Parelaphostrongylus tenuis]